jgi:rubrerythrin
MTMPKSGNDVFEMAMAMERIGKDYYKALAVASTDARVRLFCAGAAKQETEHLETFRNMKAAWAKSAGAGHILPDTAEALASLARGRILPEPAAVSKVALHGTVKDAVRLAMEMEQGAIEFYGSMVPLVPEAAQALQEIIKAEQKHLADLRAMAV